MQLIEVNNASLAKEFIKANVLMNAGNPNYIRPLDNEVNEVFDPAKNKHYKYGETKRWILKDEYGKLIGWALIVDAIKKTETACCEFSSVIHVFVVRKSSDAANKFSILIF